MSELRGEADRLAPEIVVWRREIHRFPELAFEEARTAAFVAGKLESFGLEVTTGVGRTGVLGLLRPAVTTAAGARLLRADMDALPIQEVAGRVYGSTVPGRMHACGHDAHTAMLLGAARLLSAMREQLRVPVLFCFQPAEEGGGGARLMIDDGALERVSCSEAYALHVWTPFPAGTVHVRAGPAMAAQDEFVATFAGSGGHGAFPHRTADPVLAAASAVVSLQQVVSRSIDPLCPAVVSVGSLHAGSAPNVIPESGSIHGTLRCFDETTREVLRRRIREVLEGTAVATGCRLEFDLRPGYPAVVNAAVAVDRVRRAAEEVVGAANVHEPAPMAASEDFAYFLERVPGAFVFLGAGDAARGTTAAHHTAGFDIDESILPRGAELLARIALGA